MPKILQRNTPLHKQARRNFGNVRSVSGNRKSSRCSKCKQTGHNARTCTGQINMVIKKKAWLQVRHNASKGMSSLISCATALSRLMQAIDKSKVNVDHLNDALHSLHIITTINSELNLLQGLIEYVHPRIK